MFTPISSMGSSNCIGLKFSRAQAAAAATAKQRPQRHEGWIIDASVGSGVFHVDRGGQLFVSHGFTCSPKGKVRDTRPPARGTAVAGLTSWQIRSAIGLNRRASTSRQCREHEDESGEDGQPNRCGT